MLPKPHWSDCLPPIALLLALVVCGGAFVYLLGAVIRFIAPFL